MRSHLPSTSVHKPLPSQELCSNIKLRRPPRTIESRTLGVGSTTSSCGLSHTLCLRWLPIGPALLELKSDPTNFVPLRLAYADDYYFILRLLCSSLPYNSLLSKTSPLGRSAMADPKEDAKGDANALIATATALDSARPWQSNDGGR
jgi:hypothetical protein